MTRDEMREVIRMYDSILEERRIPVTHFTDEELKGQILGMKLLSHCRGMMQKMDGMLSSDDEQTLQKANRWLGFIQGVFCAGGTFRIHTLKQHNS